VRQQTNRKSQEKSTKEDEEAISQTVIDFIFERIRSSS
jgi:hypothetical protein